MVSFAAIDAILEDETNICLGLFGDDIKRIKIEDALKMEKPKHHDLIKIIKVVNR